MHQHYTPEILESIYSVMDRFDLYSTHEFILYWKEMESNNHFIHLDQAYNYCMTFGWQSDANKRSFSSI